MSLLSKHSLSKVDHSNIIQIAAEAKVAKAKDNSVINATIGMLFDENEEFYTFKAVKHAEDKLNNIDKYAYTNTVGTKSFIDGVEKWVFQEYYDLFKEKMHVKTIATPGGSGAISNTFSNYLNEGEKVLLPSYMWSNYKQVAYENYLNYTTYNMFNDNDELDLTDIKNKFIELKNTQGRILFVINDPCHNPTGYSMEEQEWSSLIDIINEVTSDGTPFVMLYDMAYIDYDQKGMKNSRNNILKFSNLNSNCLVILAFSGSKTLGLYGLRIGAMIGASRDEANIEDFMNANQFSARTKYSMATSYGMNIIGEILTNNELNKEFRDELSTIRTMLVTRANTFLEECKNNDLKIVPFKCGFFVTIPCENDDKVYEYLVNKGVYIVPLNGALRVTIASISLENCRKLPALIKEAMNNVK